MKDFLEWLNENEEILNINPTLKIAIHGHTDDVGDAKENLQLSTNRSEEVKKYLIDKGIDKERINSFKLLLIYII